MVMRRVLVMALALVLGSSVAAQQDKAADVLKEMRKALGGDKLEAMNTLSLEGPFQRDGGMRQMGGTSALTLQFPDRMYRSEETEFPGGMSMERMSALNGNTAWEDVKQRGGMGGGMQIVMAGPGGRELSPEQLEEARVRRLRTEMMRYLLAFGGGTSLQPTWVAVAEAPEGKADVLEAKNENGATVRIFVDQQTHLPLMLQYTEVRPRMMFGGPGRGGRGGPGDGPGGRGVGRGGRGGEPGAGSPPPEGRGEPGQVRPNPEEVRRRMEQMPPPAPSNITMFLADYKEVDGVMIPHRLTQSVDGKPFEEWTIEKVKVNPSLKADFFEKK
jgi:hypothetical protein